jgi:UDP-N-acetyl-D-glucosamine/UDP-N-acetyl-D-galactosamine dehydrogenase
MNRMVSIIGLGYVCLPVAVAFGMNGRTIGFDINSERIQELKNGHV